MYKKLAWPPVAECSRDQRGQWLPSTPGGLQPGLGVQQDPAGSKQLGASAQCCSHSSGSELSIPVVCPFVLHLQDKENISLSCGRQ